MAEIGRAALHAQMQMAPHNAGGPLSLAASDGRSGWLAGVRVTHRS